MGCILWQGAHSGASAARLSRLCPLCPQLAFSGVVGIVSWKRPFTLVVGARVPVPAGKQVRGTWRDACLCHQESGSPADAEKALSICEVAGGVGRPWCRGWEHPSPELAFHFPQISFFSLLSVLCVMLSMAGSVLSCKNAQLARDFHQCTEVRFQEGELGRTEGRGSVGRGTCQAPGLVLTQAASPAPLLLRTMGRSVCAVPLTPWSGPVLIQGRN